MGTMLSQSEARLQATHRCAGAHAVGYESWTNILPDCKMSSALPAHSRHCAILHHSPSNPSTVQPIHRDLTAPQSVQQYTLHSILPSTAKHGVLHQANRQTVTNTGLSWIIDLSCCLGRLPEQAGSLDPVKGMALIIFFTPLTRTVSVLVCSLPRRRPAPQAAVYMLHRRHTEDSRQQAPQILRASRQPSRRWQAVAPAALSTQPPPRTPGPAQAWASARSHRTCGYSQPPPLPDPTYTRAYDTVRMQPTPHATHPATTRRHAPGQGRADSVHRLPCGSAGLARCQQDRGSPDGRAQRPHALVQRGPRPSSRAPRTAPRSCMVAGCLDEPC